MHAQSAVSSKHAEHTHQELMPTLSIRVRNWCVCWAYVSGTDAHAERTHQFLMRMLSISVKIPNLTRAFKVQTMLSIRVRNWCVHWACASGTIACTELTHQVLMRAQSAFPSKNAEHMHQEMMRTLSIRVRNWCIHWTYESGTDAYLEHMHQFLTRMTA